MPMLPAMRRRLSAWKKDGVLPIRYLLGIAYSSAWNR